MIKILKRVSKICANVFAVLFGVILVGGNIAVSPDAAGQINDMFGIVTQQKVSSSEEGDNIYYPTKYGSIAELKQEAFDRVAKITEEGAVLLENRNNALPLSQGATVNLYSINSVNYVFQGGGSSLAKRAETVSLKDGLEQAGLQVNAELWNWYLSNAENSDYQADHNSNTSSNGASYTINDVPWDKIGGGKENAAEAGVFVLSRYGTEATDNYITGGSAADATHGDYLQLSPREKTILQGMKSLKESGRLQKIIVLLNSVNQVQCDYVEEYGVDALLWVGEGGASGTIGIGNLLAGKVSPSGRLPDTFWKEHSYNPVYANFGEYKNWGETVSGGTKSTKYVVYQEGIYNGYRYTETRYEDVVLGRAGVGDFSWEEVVAYPFGYGLSYTGFAYDDFTAQYDAQADVYQTNITVTNTGNVAGKEVVQIYLQKPYTQYDIEHGVEKPAAELVGYGKTELLQPGQSQILTVPVERRWFASYDSNGAGTYLLESGTYYLTAATDAHNAVNNVLAAKSRSVAEGGEGVNADSSKTVGAGVPKLVQKIVFEENVDDYATAVTGEQVVNRFDDADLNRYEGRGSNSVKYVTRNDWSGTVKLGVDKERNVLGNEVKITATAKMVEDSQKGSTAIEQDDIAYPQFGDGSSYEVTLGSLLTMSDGKLQKIEYDDERWNDLLSQLTWDDIVTLLSNGLRKTYGLPVKPQTIDGNGALGPVGATSAGADAYRYSSNAAVADVRFAFLFDDPDKESSPVMYPCAALMAATFNDELVRELGDSIGEDCLWAGYSGLYGPGANIHRGAYNGRAFEYYSEDGLLSGYVCAAEVQGIREHGVYVYLKHAILNDQERNREGVNTWANEQTIREIYLRPFEIAIREGGAENVMTGFNRLGVKWTSAHGFINTVLRGEFGMQGFAVSDYWQNGYMDLVGAIMGGSALPDGDLAVGDATKSALYKYSQGYGALANAMMEEVHRILYVVVNSNAMNGTDATTRYITITPGWMGAVGAVQAAAGGIFGLSVAAYAVCCVLQIVYAKRKKQQQGI